MLKRALIASAVTLMSAVTTVALLANPAEAHSAAFTATCTTATLTATSYPAGTVMDVTVDGSLAAHKVLDKPSYADAPAVLTTTLPGTGHTVTGSITSPDKVPFLETLTTGICASPSSSVSSSVSPSTSDSSTPSATSCSSSSSSASSSPTGSSSSTPSSSVCSSPSSSVSVSATTSTSSSVCSSSSSSASASATGSSSS